MTMVTAYIIIPHDQTFDAMNKLRYFQEVAPGKHRASWIARPKPGAPENCSRLETICKIGQVSAYNGEWGHLFGPGFDCVTVEIHISEADALNQWVQGNTQGGRILLVL